MNDETEIDSKIEFDVTLQCPGCLSFGRKMLAIDKYSRVFAKLISDISFHVPSEETLLCWECHSFVLRVARFQNRVWRANNLLLNGQNKIYSTLSCLATVIIPDTTPNTIYINESNVTVKEEGDKISYSENEELDTAYPEYSNDYEDPVSDMAVKKQMVKGETVDINTRKDNNKWAKKRAVQNRKAKFKLLHVKNINIYSVMKLSVANNVPDLNYKCAECNLEFNRENIMLKHFESNHKDRFVCDVCHKLLYNKTELLTHLVKHAKSYKCKFCEFSCDNESEGRKHIMKTHPQVLRCVKCELLFTCRRDFLEHYKEWHEKFICDYCGVSFKMRYCIKDHIRKQHSPFVCVPCNKRFTRYNGLWFHNKVRHGPPTDAAYCVECDKKYPDVYRYKWHLANSVRHKPRKKIEIPCPDCEKVFSKNIYMKDHYNLVHLKHYKYRCEDCNKNFIRNADLVRHKRRVHDGILPPKNKICYVCGKGFTTNKILCNHLRTHTGERPFACTRCPARFAQQAALHGHSRAIHNHQQDAT